MTHYRQTIHVEGRNVGDIMRLPCVYSCHKEGSDSHLVFLLYDWDEMGRYKKVNIGDWLCEDCDGRWHALTDQQHSQYLKAEGGTAATAV